MTKQGPHTLTRAPLRAFDGHPARHFAPQATAPANTARVLAAGLTLGVVASVALGALSFGAYMVGRTQLAPAVERLAVALNGPATYSAIVENNGHVYVVDSGLTLEECKASFRNPNLARCERE